MRWIWIDRFLELKSGELARAVKNVTLAEDHLHDHFPGFPVMPASLMLEGMAQTGGILLGETFQFQKVVILAKVPKLEFHSWVVPGDTLIYTARLMERSEEGGMTECTAHVGDRLVAECQIMFANLPQQAAGGMDQKSFVFSMRLLGVMDVGRIENPSLSAS